MTNIEESFTTQKSKIENVDVLGLNTFKQKEIQDKLNYAAKKFQVNPKDIKVIVDISEQEAYVKNPNDNKFRSYTVSTGGPEPYKYMTEELWKVVRKMDSGLSAIYGPRLLLLARRLPNGNFVTTTIALHGTNTPEILGRPLSLGCVYFRNEDILQIYDVVNLDDLVVTIR